MSYVPIYANPNEENVEQQIVCVLNGDPLNVRQRLTTAVQCLGYHVISDNPFMARRGGRNGGESYMSMNILDYPTKLDVHFAPLTQNATQVTFDYEVHQGRYCTAQPTLAREADAIIAVAHRLAQKSECRYCGKTLLGESRFCRGCGSPLQIEPPAEIEVLRLTAGLRSGFDQIGIGAILLLLATTFYILIREGWLGDISGLALFGFIPAILGAWAFLAGIRRLAITLKNCKKVEEIKLPPSRPFFPDERPPSVIEETTKILPFQ